MNEDQIVYNGIRTPDGTVISSRHRHDFVHHQDANGDVFCVDGGLDYLKRVGSNNYQELSLTTEAPHSQIRQRAAWGTLREGNYEWVLIKDLDISHMEAILHGGHAKGVLKDIIAKELEERYYYEQA